MSRKLYFIQLGVIAVLIFAVGLLPASAQGQPKRGGTLKIITTQGDVPCLGYAPDLRLLNQILDSRPVSETLVVWNDKGQPAPHLAESWKFANDLKSITFQLRKGVKFHDGTDFDAEAVKYNLEAFQKSGRTELDMVSSFDVLDKHTIRFNLKYFTNMILTQLTMNVGMMASPAALQKMGVNDFCRNPVGTGPFKFKGWQRDLSIKFERFDGYWQKGKPYLDGFEWLHIKDPMTAVSSFVAGEADAIIGVPYTQAAELKKSGQYVIRGAYNSHNSIISDSGNPKSPFSKLKVRQAVSYAIDPKAINDAIYYGMAEVTNQFSPAKSWGYNNKVAAYPYDPQKAKKLLAEAGYPNGFKTTLWYMNADVRPQVATALQAYLKEVGIEVDVKLLDLSAWMDKLRSGWDGLIYLGLGVTIPDDGRSGILLSNCKATLFKSMECVKELEDQMFKVTTASDAKTKAALFQEYNRLITDKYCLVNWISVFPTMSVMKKNIRDIDLFDISFIQFDPSDTYLAK